MTRAAHRTIAGTARASYLGAMDAPSASGPVSGAPRVRELRVDDAADLAFVRAMMERTPSVGFPSWFTLEQLVERQREMVAALLDRLATRRLGATTCGALAPRPARDEPVAEVVLVAESDAATRAGFAWVRTVIDHFGRVPVAHIEDLATAPGHEGQGIGAALVQQAEAWARAHRLAGLTLNVWPENTRARALYERSGLAPEMLRMRKVL